MGLNSSFAQFTPAVFPEYSAGINVSNDRTGSDVLDDNADTYRVTCFTDFKANPHPGISWTVSFSGAIPGTTGHADFSLSSISGATNALYADICLVKDQNNIVHALTAWYFLSPYSKGWVIEDFMWDNATSQFISNGITDIASGGQGTTVNIDADDQGHFVVVYDDIVKHIYAVSGSVTTCSSCSSGTGVALDQFATGSGVTPLELNRGVNPDVCIYKNATTESVHVAYINLMLPGELIVDDYTYTSLGNPTTTPQLNPSLDALVYYTGYYYPRIASPNSSFGDEWTVVVEDYDRVNSYSSNYYIVGYNSATNTLPIPYNDGATYFNLVSTIGNPNTFPVVCYDHNSKVWVGWNLDATINSTIIGPPPSAAFPVVVPCNNHGVPYSLSFPANMTYYEVPTTLNTGDHVYNISLASRYSNDLYLSYFNYKNRDILTKEVTPNSLRSLRIDGKQNTSFSIDNLLNLVSAESVLNVSVYDETGKLILSERGDKNKILNNTKYAFLKYSFSVFMVHIISDDGIVNASAKFFAGK